MRTHTQDTQAALRPEEALDYLREGNARFQANLRANRNILEQVNTTANGQYPFAVVLSCIDSRTSAELIFDQGLGDIFSVRIAGNVLNEDILGSMEFACKLANSKLVVVMGHSACGAVKGACENAQLGHLSGLLAKIEPAVEFARAAGDLPPEELVQLAAEKNVELTTTDIISRSPVLRTMIEAGDIGIVGAMYSVQSGAIEFGELTCGMNH